MLTGRASLLANARCQSTLMYLTHRVRQQAGAYSEVRGRWGDSALCVPAMEISFWPQAVGARLASDLPGTGSQIRHPSAVRHTASAGFAAATRQIAAKPGSHAFGEARVANDSLSGLLKSRRLFDTFRPKATPTSHPPPETKKPAHRRAFSYDASERIARPE